MKLDWSSENSGSYVTIFNAPDDVRLKVFDWDFRNNNQSQSISDFHLNTVNRQLQGGTTGVILDGSNKFDKIISVVPEMEGFSYLISAERGGQSYVLRKVFGLTCLQNSTVECSIGQKVVDGVSIVSNVRKVTTQPYLNKKLLTEFDLNPKIAIWQPNLKGENIEFEAVCGPTLNPTFSPTLTLRYPQ